MELTSEGERRVRQSLRSSLAVRGRLGVAAGLLALIVASAYLLPSPPGRLPLVALAALVVLSLIASLAPAGSRISDGSAGAHVRFQATLAGIALMGASWGAAGLLLFPQEPAARIALATIWFAAACLPMPMLLGSRAALVVWPVAVLLPLLVRLLIDADPASPRIDLLVALLLLLLIDSGMRQHARLLASRRAEIEREDLTRQLQAQVVQDQKSSSDKTRFLATAAHDLRQPLHALGIFCAALEERLDASPERSLVRSMRKSIEALERLFSAMLDVSRLDAGAVTPSPQVFPVRDVFRRLYLHYAGDAELKDVSLRFRAAGKLVRSDPQLLERLLSNLVSNALRYTQRGGVLVAARRGGPGRIRIEVWDTGVGIPESQLGRVFEEFYQIDNPERDRSTGLGMGLPIVRRLSDLLEHPLHVRSVQGRGSLFGITVPAELEGVPLSAQLGADTLPPRMVREVVVLLIDDEREIREAMRELLVPRHVKLIEAATIAEALAAARNSGRIDLILADLRLRGQEDGISAVSAVRRITGDSTLAVLITGETSPAALREAQESGLVIMFKPLRPQDLLGLIERLSR